jgi:toluene monooxygenase system ferredoxin subunit
VKPALRVVGAAANGNLLAQAPFFAGLSPARLARVAALGRVERHPQDSQIYVLGDPADDFYVLAEGMVRFTLGLGKRATSAGEIIRRGQVFGWAAVVENARTRIANAYCLTPCEVIAIDGKQLMALMDADHSIGYALTKQLAVLLTSELTSFAAG